MAPLQAHAVPVEGEDDVGAPSCLELTLQGSPYIAPAAAARLLSLALKAGSQPEAEEVIPLVTLGLCVQHVHWAWSDDNGG